MRSASFHALAGGILLGLLATGLLLGGCTGNLGDDCLTDSDCSRPLVCVVSAERIDGKVYSDKWGFCADDAADGDGIPSDGDFSGSTVDNRCGIQAVIDQSSGYEKVIKEISDHCDDNCPQVSNAKVLQRFACFAKDSCCSLSDAQRAAAKDYQLCEEVTPQKDTCYASCLEGSPPTPRFCFYLKTFDAVSGLEVDPKGCILCGPAKKTISCSSNDDCAGLVKSDCAADDNSCLPAPACSGAWECSGKPKICKIAPTLVDDTDKNSNRILYQLDQDGDGVGDACDNCPAVPNGIECASPLFASHCDIDGDKVTTPAELALGNQADKDADGLGDACDLCPTLPNSCTLCAAAMPDSGKDPCLVCSKQTVNDNGDIDGDKCGNPCDPDQDGDGWCDAGRLSCDAATGANACTGLYFQKICKVCHGVDNCPTIPNPDQKDTDGDGVGDACDNCPTVANPIPACTSNSDCPTGTGPCIIALKLCTSQPRIQCQ